VDPRRGSPRPSRALLEHRAKQGAGAERKEPTPEERKAANAALIERSKQERARRKGDSRAEETLKSVQPRLQKLDRAEALLKQGTREARIAALKEFMGEDVVMNDLLLDISHAVTDPAAPVTAQDLPKLIDERARKLLKEEQDRARAAEEARSQQMRDTYAEGIETAFVASPGKFPTVEKFAAMGRIDLDDVVMRLDRDYRSGARQVLEAEEVLATLEAELREAEEDQRALEESRRARGQRASAPDRPDGDKGESRGASKESAARESGRAVAATVTDRWSQGAVPVSKEPPKRMTPAEYRKNEKALLHESLKRKGLVQ
jgi:hypothetical protein